jgi:hypothetical protein
VDRVQVWALIEGVRLVSHLPAGLPPAVASANGVRLADSGVLKDYSRTERPNT